MSIYTPYFYVIQDVRNGMYYAGSKYGKDANPDNFMIKGGYTTSSNLIKNIIEEQGFNSFIIRKLKKFKTANETVDYETKFLRKIDAAAHPSFYNCHNNNFNSYGSLLWKEAMIRQFGVPYPMQCEEVQEKSKQTCLEKYGVEYSFQSENNRQKSRQTCLDKYGVDNPAKSKEIQEKSKHTCLEKYGVEYSSQSKNNKEKSKQTCLEKYGVEFHTQVKEINDKRVSSRKKTISSTEWKETVGKEAILKRKETMFGNEENTETFKNSIKEGMSNMPIEKKEKRSASLSKSLSEYFEKNKTIWINDGSKNKVITVDKKDEYVSEGWNIGRMKRKAHNEN